jgi:hypothetical protein
MAMPVQPMAVRGREHQAAGVRWLQLIAQAVPGASPYR